MKENRKENFEVKEEKDEKKKARQEAEFLRSVGDVFTRVFQELGMDVTMIEEGSPEKPGFSVYGMIAPFQGMEGPYRDYSPAEGCGEESFLEMLSDMTAMRGMLTGAYEMSVMLMNKRINADIVSGVVKQYRMEADRIMKKWEAYRKCDA